MTLTYLGEISTHVFTMDQHQSHLFATYLSTVILTY